MLQWEVPAAGPAPDYLTLVRSHKELIAWQRAHRVAVEVQRYGAANWSAAYSAVLDQLRRSSLSVDLNIVEGFASGRGARCKYHLRIAFGSAAETVALLEMLIELGGPDIGEVERLHRTAKESRFLVLRLWQATRA